MSKNMIIKKEGFIYIWYDKARKMYYIGCHWGTEYDGYICSSDRMRKAFRNRPEDFSRRIIRRNIPSRDLLLQEEHKWLSLIKPEELGRKYYNHSQRQFGHWATDPSRLEVVGKRISEINKGRKHNLSLEEKAARGRLISESKKQKREEKKSLGLPIYNKSDSWVPQNVGRIQSEEEKNKRKESMRKAREEGRWKGNKGKTIVWSEDRKKKHAEVMSSAQHDHKKYSQKYSDANKKAWAEGKYANRKSNNMKDYIWIHYKDTLINSRIPKDQYCSEKHILGRKP